MIEIHWLQFVTWIVCAIWFGYVIRGVIDDFKKFK